MNDQAKLVSKVLVLDSSAECHDRIKAFCDDNNLVGLKVQDDNVMSVFKSNIDLGAILLSEKYAGSPNGGIGLARKVHAIRPELPIFLRREKSDRLDDLSEQDQRLFRAAYTIDRITNLRSAIDKCIFSLAYPNVLVRGITELTKIVLENQFKCMLAEIDTPYLVRDRIIFGEIFTLIPIESSWCRGYMMLQIEEEPLLHLVRTDKTHANPGGANDFRVLNDVLGEITNLVWGAFRSRYITCEDNIAHLAQVPIIVNHLHRYISFGSEDPQLCFKYTMTDQNHRDARSLVIYQRFVFNMSWSPDDFKECQSSIEDLFETGELELF